MKVSVLMPTYNHGAFITKAIESFLNQDFEEEMELLISDDMSTDNTLSIAKNFEKKHPQKIKVFAQQENGGLINNYLFLMERVTGEYVAILESDDLWVTSDKIRKQVEFLDKHPDHALSFSNWLKLKNDITEEQMIGSWHSHHPQVFYENLLLRNLIKSPTVIFRYSYFKKHCDLAEYKKLEFVTFDYPVWLTLAKFYPFHFLNETTSAYRYLTSSLSNSGSLQKKLKFEDGIHQIRNYIIEKYGMGKLSVFSLGKREIIVKSRHILRAGNPILTINYFIRSIIGLIKHQTLGKKNIFTP
jgi:glycosyltransferase involved in cell wall biosynthesis